MPEGVRVQKFLAQAGVGSRRQCDAMVAEGRVSVNGQLADPGTRVDPLHDRVELDGSRVCVDAEVVVLALNKPAGVVTTMADDQGRPCVGDLVRDQPQRLFHVGRLDEDTEGLLLLTNDGDLANLLTHPSHGVPKTYVARVRGRMSSASAQRLLAGIELEDGPVAADAIEVKLANERYSVVEIVIHVGRKRIVRRMLKAVGHPVEELTRTAIGGLGLGSLRSGALRRLSAQEVATLTNDAR